MTQRHHHLPIELILCFHRCLPSIVVVTIKEITANGRDIWKDIPNAALWVETTHPTFDIPKLYFVREMYV